jgi:hypothetical protein
MSDILGTWINVSYEIGSFTKPVDLGTIFNAHTGGIGFTGIIMAIWFILFLALKSRDVEESMIVASFSTIILSGILYFAELVPDTTVILTIGLLAFSAFFKLIKE